jgi:RimJ/RimL family protein N-acetyltransferase
MTIRPAAPDDAAALVDLKRALDEETAFMLLEPGERRDTRDDMERRLRTIESEENSIFLVAWEGDEPAGYVEARGGEFHRNRHSAHVVIGVRQASSGQGIGTKLLHELDDWAPRHGVTRLELTVMAHNERAIALYRRSGFELEGTRRRSLLVDGRWVDELALAKLLDDS